MLHKDEQNASQLLDSQNASPVMLSVTRLLVRFGVVYPDVDGVGGW